MKGYVVGAGFEPAITGLWDPWVRPLLNPTICSETKIRTSILDFKDLCPTVRRSRNMAPPAGLGPATKWLTITYSTIELERNIREPYWNRTSASPFCRRQRFHFANDSYVTVLGIEPRFMGSEPIFLPVRRLCNISTPPRNRTWHLVFIRNAFYQSTTGVFGAKYGNRTHNPYLASRNFTTKLISLLDQVRRIGLRHSVWKTDTLPLHHTRFKVNQLGLEPRTLGLKGPCSAIELLVLVRPWRELNPPPIAWQAIALPMSYRIIVDLRGIEPPHSVCKTDVLPLDYKPWFWGSNISGGF